jgi:two-component system osmolarity sensor histidine kinase EnvZ
MTAEALPRRRQPLAARLGGWLLLVALLAAGLQALLLQRALAGARDDTLNALGAQLRQAQRLLSGAPPAQRPTLAAQLALQGLPLQPEGPSTDPQALPMPEPPAGLVAALSAASGLALAVRPLPGPGEGTHWLAGFTVDGQRWWLEQEAPHGLDPATDTVWLVATLGIGLLAAVAAAWAADRLTRPLGALATAWRERRGTPHPTGPRPGASLEEAWLAEAYEDLQQGWAQRLSRRRQALAGLSHDLRTPLARLRLRAECELADPLRGRVEADLDAADRMIRQFMGYLESEDGEQAAGWPEPVDEVLRHALRPYVERHGVQARLDLQTDTPPLAPDLALQRLLSNLVDNALAHGQGQVTVELQAGPADWTLWVADQGRGIAAAELAAALQPFVKLPGGRGRECGHAGLGLAIVAELARALGGRVVHRPWDGQGWALGVRVPRTA